ncbi:hypothetical protein [Halorussus caseinilyticus]|nr:hypothetical protein [Halorussus sp. DT72]
MSAEDISPDEMIEQFENDHSGEDDSPPTHDAWCTITATKE